MPQYLKSLERVHISTHIIYISISSHFSSLISLQFHLSKILSSHLYMSPISRPNHCQKWQCLALFVLERTPQLLQAWVRPRTASGQSTGRLAELDSPSGRYNSNFKKSISFPNIEAKTIYPIVRIYTFQFFIAVNATPDPLQIETKIASIQAFGALLGLLTQQINY